MGLTMVERTAVTKETVARYRRAPKKGKGLILDELCALTGWNRDHARRALRQAAGPAKPRQPRRRVLVYGPELQAPLAKVWATLDGPCGKRQGGSEKEPGTRPPLRAIRRAHRAGGLPGGLVTGPGERHGSDDGAHPGRCRP